MLIIDTGQAYAPGYIEVSVDLLRALANIVDANPTAEAISAGFEYHDDERDADVWHVMVDGLAISGEIGEGYEERNYRYVITDKGELLGVEQGRETDGGDWDWWHVDYHEDTWEVHE